jgi:hypothetical protein
MPRWYDIPVIWLGLQAIVLAAFVGLVRWRWPAVSDSTSGMLVGGALALTVIGAALLKRSLIKRDETTRTSP